MTIEITRFSPDFPAHRQVVSGPPLEDTTSHDTAQGTGIVAAPTSANLGGQMWRIRVIGETRVTWINGKVERFGDGHVEYRHVSVGVGITAVV